MCTDKDIQELLPAYLEQGLVEAETLRIEKHLAGCHDCSTEIALLQLLNGEPVPDPGPDFWSTMPNKVYLAAQEQESKIKIVDLASIMNWMTFPRLVGTAATVGIVLVTSWFALRPLPKNDASAPSQPYTMSYEDTLIPDPMVYSVNVAELGHNELKTVDRWAQKELASIVNEAEQVMAYNHDSDLYEEISRLNESEADRVSETLNRLQQEG